MRIWLANMVIFHAEKLTNNIGFGRIFWMCLKPVIIPKVMAVLMRKLWLTSDSGESYFRQTQMEISINGTLPWSGTAVEHRVWSYQNVSFAQGLCLPKWFVLAHQSAVNGFCCQGLRTVHRLRTVHQLISVIFWAKLRYPARLRNGF